MTGRNGRHAARLANEIEKLGFRLDLKICHCKFTAKLPNAQFIALSNR